MKSNVWLKGMGCTKQCRLEKERKHRRRALEEAWQKMEQKENEKEIRIRIMVPEDYEQVYRLWCGIKGFGIRSMDDSREGVEKFLKRNPTTSVVAMDKDEIIGAILCGHDGRRGCFYHVCVKETHRKHGIGKKMAAFAMQRLQEEGINKVSLIAFKSNRGGNKFWRKVGWTFREDLNYYDFTLNEENITRFIE